MPEFNSLFKNSYEITRSIWKTFSNIHAYNYSCMSCMNFYTNMYNHKVLNDKSNETRINNCNCRNKDTCPLPNTCQTKCIIYQANIACDIAWYKQKCYLGSCEATSKDRFGNYKKSFNHVKHKNDTELSK